MKWVSTDLNSPWHPVDHIHPDEARDFPNQCRLVSEELHAQLTEAWDRLMKLSRRVDEEFPPAEGAIKE